MKHIFVIVGLLAGLLSLQAQAAAGRFQFVSGDVKVTSAGGKERVAHKGDDVNEGDSITSSNTATAQVKMRDDGLIIVRPDTKLRITTFQFNGKADGSERSLITLVKGGFRALTGMIGHFNKDNYKIETPTATIGIRGTDHEPMFIPNPVAGHPATIEPGTYDKVNSGAAVLSTARGMVLINPNHAGFVPNIVNALPVVLSNIPKFYLPPGKDEPVIVPGAALQPGTQPTAQTGSTGNTGTTTLSTTTLTVVRPATSTLLVAPATTLQVAPTTTLIAPATLQVAPVATTIAPATLQVAPVTTIQPITTVAPATLQVAPVTTIQPVTTVAPTTLQVAPSTLQIAPVTTFSDRRLKKNIKRIGTHPLGVGIYEFDYIWGEHATGVMADEVKLVRPEAVIRDKSGYDMVDYSKLN